MGVVAPCQSCVMCEQSIFFVMCVQVLTCILTFVYLFVRVYLENVKYIHIDAQVCVRVCCGASWKDHHRGSGTNVLINEHSRASHNHVAM